METSDNSYRNHEIDMPVSNPHGSSPDILVVPCCQLVRTNGALGEDEYKPASWRDSDEHGMLAGDLRLKGVVAEHVRNLRAVASSKETLMPIVFMGGRTPLVDGTVDTAAPFESEAFRASFAQLQLYAFSELPDGTELQSIAADTSVLAEKSETSMSEDTATNLTLAAGYFMIKGYYRPRFVTNRYMTPRLRLMTHMILEQMDMHDTTNPSFVVAEDVASEVFGESFIAEQARAYASSAAIARTRSEIGGLSALLTGRYKHRFLEGYTVANRGEAGMAFLALYSLASMLDGSPDTT